MSNCFRLLEMIASHISEVIKQSQRDYVEIVLWINLLKLISV